MDALKDRVGAPRCARSSRASPTASTAAPTCMDGDGNTPVPATRSAPRSPSPATRRSIDFTRLEPAGGGLDQPAVRLHRVGGLQRHHPARRLGDRRSTTAASGRLRFVAPRGLDRERPAARADVRLAPTDGPLHVIEAMLGALAQAIPDRVIAGSYATLQRRRRLGHRATTATRSCSGSSTRAAGGATSRRDGWNCTPNQSANFCDYPVEIIESVYPVRCDAIELLAGSGGAGRHRGGPGHGARVHVPHAHEPERVRRPPRAAPARAPRRRGRRAEPLPAAPRRRRRPGRASRTRPATRASSRT